MSQHKATTSQQLVGRYHKRFGHAVPDSVLFSAADKPGGVKALDQQMEDALASGSPVPGWDRKPTPGVLT